MKPFRSLAPCWRPWIQAALQKPIVTRFPQPTVSRQLSRLAASSRSQLRSNGIIAEIARKRWNSSALASTQGTENGAAAGGAENPSPTTAAEPESPKRDEPAYEITFTCKPCQTRSTHKISKQGYHHGTILITCPDCKNRHLICDHLNIFRDKSTTIEDILKEKGELIKRGTVGTDGDIEIWDDSTTTDRNTAGQSSGTATTLDKEARTPPPTP